PGEFVACFAGLVNLSKRIVQLFHGDYISEASPQTNKNKPRRRWTPRSKQVLSAGSASSTSEAFDRSHKNPLRFPLRLCVSAVKIDSFPSRSLAELHAQQRAGCGVGWEAGIRTPIGRSRICSPTVGRPPSDKPSLTRGSVFQAWVVALDQR